MTNNQSAAAPDADRTRERAMPNIRTSTYSRGVDAL